MSDPTPSPRIQPWSIWLVIGLMAGGILVAFNYVKRNRTEAFSSRPPFVGKLERDLTAQNRNGATVQLASLKEKIWVACYLFADSPRNGPAVTRKLGGIWDEFQSDARFHIVTFSVDSEADTETKRNAFLQEHGRDVDRWWFLTAEEREIPNYMGRYLRMKPTKPVSDPALLQEWGRYAHDVRVVLIDGKANVRGFYQLLHPDTGEANLERLRQDLRYLLDEEGTSASSSSNP